MINNIDCLTKNETIKENNSCHHESDQNHLLSRNPLV
jgi:hypothetical protein